MAEIHGGQIAARQLRAAGIDTVFGVVAGPMIELFAGGQEAGLRVVGCRHEINGGFMAQAWGWQKQRAGVLIVGSGPALTNAITPLYVATASATAPARPPRGRSAVCRRPRRRRRSAGRSPTAD